MMSRVKNLSTSGSAIIAAALAVALPYARYLGRNYAPRGRGGRALEQTRVIFVFASDTGGKGERGVCGGGAVFSESRFA